MSRSQFVCIALHADGLETAREMLKGFPDEVLAKAARTAVYRARRTLETESNREIVKKYDITQANVRTQRNVRYAAQYSPGAGVTAEILFSGRQIPLHRFRSTVPKTYTQDDIKNVVFARTSSGVGWHRLFQSVPVSGRVKLGESMTQFKHVFTATVKAGTHGATHTGVWQRTGAYNSDGIEKIKEISAISVAQMLNNEEVRANLQEKTVDAFDKRLSENVNAILNGYWKEKKK